MPRELAALPLMLALLACAGEPRRATRDTVAATPRCAAAHVAAVGPAVLAYISTARPTPQRFLVAAGTDSALPEAGVKALQQKGPTYLYPADPAQRARVRERLAEVGDYASLLVSLQESRAVGDTQAVVRLGGSYVGGRHDGRPSPNRTIYLGCDSAGWTVRRAADAVSA